MPDPIDQAAVLAAEFAALHPGAIQPGAKLHPHGPNPSLDDRIQAYHAAVHGLAQGQSALCLSGGGVRSAAFSLGVLQGLARHGLLCQFDYLSTVSGGGYIGCWATAWAHRAADRGDLAGFEAMVARRPAWAMQERAPMAWLRRTQRFLTPRAGGLSGDTWAGVALFIRDLLLNWAVFLPAIMAVLLLPRAIELALVWWAAAGAHSGSGFGYLLNVGDWVRGVLLLPTPTAPLSEPEWMGWSDVAGAIAAMTAMAAIYLSRPSGAFPLTDGIFWRRIMLPLALAGALLLSNIAVTLANGAPPDRTILMTWLVGGPLALVSARVVARVATVVKRGVELDDVRLGWDLLACAAAGLVTGALAYTAMRLRCGVGWDRGTVRDIAVFGAPALLLALFAGQIAYAGLACSLPYGRRDQEWMGRAGGFYLLAALGWTAASGIVLYGAQLHQYMGEIKTAFGLSGAVTLASAATSLTRANAAMETLRKQVPAGLVLKLAAGIFLLCALVLLTQASNWAVEHVTGVDLRDRADVLVARLSRELQSPTPYLGDHVERLLALEPVWHRAMVAFGWTVAAIVALGLVSAALSVFVDVNLFSLHALYRNRLIRTFLGASNAEEVTGREPERSPFDGFSRRDDVKLSEIWRDGSRLRREGPFPVINMALNLVGGSDPALQDRKAAPFVATPLHVGGEAVGFAEHARYGKHRLSLGTAMAISGAAASPNWGYHSSPLIGFVLMLFNLRLGWWLENPWRVQEKRILPRSWKLFRQEALGQTTADDAYVYLSDGGHFDNLGLYEMLRRRCRLIVVVDASQDENMSLDDLGRSMRQASIDFGVTVTFDKVPFSKRTDPASAGVYAMTGSISYPEDTRDSGTLIYLKPGFFTDAPADVRAYAAGNKSFPHDSTFNQWFTESQFESYRALGLHVVAKVTGTARNPDLSLDLAELPRLAARYLQAQEPVKEARPAGARPVATILRLRPSAGRRHA